MAGVHDLTPARLVRARSWPSHCRYRGPSRRDAGCANAAPGPGHLNALQAGSQFAGGSGRGQEPQSPLHLGRQPVFEGAIQDHEIQIRLPGALWQHRRCQEPLPDILCLVQRPALPFRRGHMTPHSVHYGQVQSMREVMKATLNAAFSATPNRFKGIRPCLKPMPNAAWINPPPKQRKPTETAQPCTVNL